MSGKHRKHSEVRTAVAKRGGSGVAAAALSITGLSTAVVTGTTAAVAPNVQLMALVSAANSTSQFFAGSSYYGTDWKDLYLNGPNETQEVVPFLRGPQGIADVITGAQTGPGQTGVTASGWGAGQTGTALGILDDQGYNFNEIGIVILDNNTNRAGGGFWTTYAPFAPLLFTSADPTPSDIPGLKVLDVAYEYNINSDAPVDPLNPFAIGNSLAAYAFGYGEESTALDITQTQEGGPIMFQPSTPNSAPVVLKPGFHYIIKDGVIVNGGGNGEALPAGTTTTYVTVEASELPLTRPLRLIPGGDILANAIDPVMTDLVNAGYNDGLGTPGNPAIPDDPTVPRPMKPFSSLSALEAGDLQDDVQGGATTGAQTAIEDVTNPGNFITKPIGEVGKLPVLSSLTSGGSGIIPFSANSANKVVPNAAKTGASSSTGNSNPLKKIGDDFNSSLKKFADSLKKPAAPKSGDDGS